MTHPTTFHPRRQFLQAALQGLGTMMVGCGYDQGARPPGGTANDWAKDIPRSPGGGAPGDGAGGAGGTGGVERSPGADSDFLRVGPLGEPNDDGVRVPDGYRARIVARSGEAVPGTNFVWPSFPDGGVCIPTPDGGYLYVCNSEVDLGSGGVAVLRFDAGGHIIDAYSILTGTSKNCQGGLTPWGAFLSCEEVPFGLTYECDPFGNAEAIVRPLLGAFKHEGLAYDETNHHIYLTEDEVDGLFHRFVPDRLTPMGYADLSAGRLQVAEASPSGKITWHDLPDPTGAGMVPTRYQLSDVSPFNGGEGIWWQDNVVYFSTKGDDRIWSYKTESAQLEVIYDAAAATNPILTGVDMVIGATGGELLIAEDQGDMQAVVLTPTGELLPLLQIIGQDTSEITGIAFAPSFRRLYFSSQRGNTLGITYEMTRL